MPGKSQVLTLSVAEAGQMLGISRNHAVPDGMPEAQAIIWERIVGRMPNDWFKKEHVELLRAYTARAAMAHQLERKVASFQPEWMDVAGGPEQLDLLNKMLDREHRAMLVLARAMRLTHQAQYAPQKASTLARQPGGDRVRPWDKFADSRSVS